MEKVCVRVKNLKEKSDSNKLLKEGIGIRLNNQFFLILKIIERLETSCIVSLIPLNERSFMELMLSPLSEKQISIELA